MDRLKRYFHERDQLCKAFGIELTTIEAGHAVARLELGKAHWNGLNMTHGGTLFTLADVTAAAAANSHGPAAVAISANIHFAQATSEGVLTAEAREISCNRRLGIYDVQITDEAGDVIASFQSTVYRKDKPLLNDGN